MARAHKVVRKDIRTQRAEEQQEAHDGPAEAAEADAPAPDAVPSQEPQSDEIDWLGDALARVVEQEPLDESFIENAWINDTDNPEHFDDVLPNEMAIVTEHGDIQDVEKPPEDPT